MIDRPPAGRQGLPGLRGDSQVLVNVRQIASLEAQQLHARSASERIRAVHRIAQHLGLDPATYLTDAPLAEETDIERLASRMNEAMPDVPGTAAVTPPRPGGINPS